MPLRSWFVDCSLVATRNSAFSIFLRFLILAISATCGDSPRRRFLAFWTSAQMRQEGRDPLARHLPACSLQGVFSHGGSLSDPTWPQSSRIGAWKGVSQAQSDGGGRKGCLTSLSQARGPPHPRAKRVGCMRLLGLSAMLQPLSVTVIHALRSIRTPPSDSRRRGWQLHQHG